MSNLPVNDKHINNILFLQTLSITACSSLRNGAVFSLTTNIKYSTKFQITHFINNSLQQSTQRSDVSLVFPQNGFQQTGKNVHVNLWYGLGSQFQYKRHYCK